MNATALIAALPLLLAPMAGASCGQGDFDGNGFVDGADLGVLLGQWGLAGEADLDESGAVDGADLGILLGSWGPSSLESGSFPESWINGGASCPNEPDMQVHWYNDDMAILRQSLCTNFEAPFVMLLFGDERVFMMDSGAGGIPIASIVQDVVQEWLDARDGIDSIELIVAHTHGHGDHVAGNGQLSALPNTQVVGNSQAAVAAFFEIDDWPMQAVEYDLGNRIVDVVPIPGHQSAHVAFYDRATGILFTGDTLYPGRLYINNFHQYVQSINRLVEFTADKPLCWVLGTHIEMSNTPGDDFPLGSTSHPDEHPLQLTRAHLLELQAAILAMGADPVYEVHDDFIIFPLGGIALQDGTDPDCSRPHSVMQLRPRR